MPELSTPATVLHIAWLEAHVEWGPGLHEDGFGLLPTDEVDSLAGFTVWLARLADDRHCTYRWILEDGQVLGGIALRHESNPLVQRAGHIGYGIRPSARRCGLGTWAVARIVGQARALGMGQILAICEAGNVASAKVIERQGGVLEDDCDTVVDPTWRYWMKTDQSSK